MIRIPSRGHHKRLLRHWCAPNVGSCLEMLKIWVQAIRIGRLGLVFVSVAVTHDSYPHRFELCSDLLLGMDRWSSSSWSSCEIRFNDFSLYAEGEPWIWSKLSLAADVYRHLIERVSYFAHHAYWSKRRRDFLSHTSTLYILAAVVNAFGSIVYYERALTHTNCPCLTLSHSGSMKVNWLRSVP